MIRANGKSGFTLIELLVVVAMIALIMGAMGASVSAAQNRARVQKATAEVKTITQAILAYENYASDGDNKLEEMKNRDADADSLGFLLGTKGTSRGNQIPVLLMAALQSGGKMLDPWGKPYKISIHVGSGSVETGNIGDSMKAGYFLPNFYRLNPDERELWTE